ncbi:hypothetical protein [Polaromonas sp. SM01]|uniref:hypothetical protein n=1 Tax=Polaromonas sp. SM01 TaxID=3085630 RepID=UPI0029829380|nr:hypothetical protein [Polaromonas sp. SM01]MDW5444317.1 hypothetical protein [Polaromonas sp. SM01]
MRKWISPAVLDWEPDVSSGIRSDPERVRRPHAILSHSENVLSKSESEFSVADSILSLKRAINSRLQHLEDLYEFQGMFPKSVGSLERLEEVGLARPFLIKQLFDLRNNIEHNDAPPPSAERTRELVDATWYFLRTTDYACKLRPDGVMLRSAEDGSFPPEQWLEITVIRDQPQRFNIGGWVSLDLISDHEQPGFTPIEVSIFRPKRQLPKGPVDSITMSAYKQNSMRGDDERWIQAHADLPQEVRRKIWRLAFEAL